MVLALVAGCQSEDYASIPVPTTQKVPFTYQGHIGRMWGGDNFEVIRDGKLHYAFIRGIDTPEPGQPFHEEAKNLLWDLGKNRNIVVSVVARDAWKREISDIVIKDPADGKVIDLALELVNRGLAWHDLSDEPWANRFREAEAKARSQRVGIWSQEDPVPPWEFWNRQLQQAQESSN